MKILKVLLIVMSFTLLVGCESKQEDIIFDSKDFEYIGVTDDDYLLFRNGDDELELIFQEHDVLRASYEKGIDIYLIIGTEDDFEIRKNGTLIQICTGEVLACTGFQPVDFSEDIPTLFEVFEEEGISVSMIILGVLVITAAVSLFFLPKRFFSKIKIKNNKIGQLVILRIVTILMIVIGVAIIIFSI